MGNALQEVCVCDASKARRWPFYAIPGLVPGKLAKCFFCPADLPAHRSVAMGVSVGVPVGMPVGVPMGVPVGKVKRKERRKVMSQKIEK